MTKRPAAPTYPIRAVARMTGLSVDTLRAWERRYDAVEPRREGRGRVYDSADVARLQQLATLVERGHSIGTVAGLPTLELTRLLDKADALSARSTEAPAVDLAPLFRALDKYQLEEIEAVLARYGAVLPTRDLVFTVILPLLRLLGERWEAGTLSPAQEHMVSAVVRSILGNTLRAIGRPEAPLKVLFATPSGERHELGLLCAAILAASAGYGVLYLGPEVPADDIARAASVSGARLVVLGATTHNAITRAEGRNLGKALQHVDLWIGGPQAVRLLGDVGHGRRIDTLDDLLPMLSRLAH